MNYLLVFCLGATIDLMYVLWVQSVTKKEILKSGLYSVGVAAPGIFGYLEIVDNTWMAVPYLAGLATGTMATLYVQSKKDE